MSNSSIASIGRFSSQILTYLGTQKTVKHINGSTVNTFKYATSPTNFIDPASLSQSRESTGVVGNYSLDSYDSTKCYFISRGSSALYADAMTALAIDMANSLGISTQTLLEQSDVSRRLLLSPNASRVLNSLRDSSHQVGYYSTTLNKNSLKAREIRA